MFPLKFLPIPFLLFGCGTHECYVPAYIMGYDSVTLANKQKWVVDVVKAASNQMSTSDYEDVDETIQQANVESDKLFPKTVKKLGVAHLKYNLFTGCGGADCVFEDDLQDLSFADSNKIEKIQPIFINYMKKMECPDGK